MTNSESRILDFVVVVLLYQRRLEYPRFSSGVLDPEGGLKAKPVHRRSPRCLNNAYSIALHDWELQSSLVNAAIVIGPGKVRVKMNDKSIY